MLDSGCGMLIIQSTSTLLRNSNCPATVKETLIRLLVKCIVVFGSILSEEYLRTSVFCSVRAEVLTHSLTGQWKKVKNVLKTLCK